MDLILDPSNSSSTFHLQAYAQWMIGLPNGIITGLFLRNTQFSKQELDGTVLTDPSPFSPPTIISPLQNLALLFKASSLLGYSSKALSRSSMAPTSSPE